MKAAVEVKQGFDLAKALAGGKLAMANVDAVPAGKYGKAALEKLGAWDGVKTASPRPRMCVRRFCWWRVARHRSASSTRPTPPRSRM